MKIIGWILISIPFVILFMFAVIEVGILETIAIYSIMALVFCCVYFGTKLLEEKDDN